MDEIRNNFLIENIILKLDNYNCIKFNVNTGVNEPDIIQKEINKNKECVRNIVGEYKTEVNKRAKQRFKKIRPKAYTGFNFGEMLGEQKGRVITYPKLHGWKFGAYVANDIIGITYETLGNYIWYNLWLPTKNYEDYKDMLYVEPIGTNELSPIGDFMSIIKITCEKVEDDEYEYDNDIQVYEYYLNEIETTVSDDVPALDTRVTIAEHPDYVVIQLLIPLISNK